MKKIIDKEKVLMKVEKGLVELKKNTPSILMALALFMHVIATVYQKGFDLINRYPDFIRDCVGIIIDAFNQTAKQIMVRAEAEPRLKEDVMEFIHDIEGLSDLYETLQDKLEEYVDNENKTNEKVDPEEEEEFKKSE